MKYVCLAVVAMVCGWADAARGGGSVTVWAHDFDTANTRVSRVGQAYADKHSCIWNGQKYPNQAEYELELPVTGLCRDLYDRLIDEGGADFDHSALFTLYR